MKKTEIIPIGILRNKNILLLIDLKEIRIKHGPFKALGCGSPLITEKHKNSISMRD